MDGRPYGPDHVMRVTVVDSIGDPFRRGVEYLAMTTEIVDYHRVGSEQPANRDTFEGSCACNVC